MKAPPASLAKLLQARLEDGRVVGQRARHSPHPRLLALAAAHMLPSELFIRSLVVKIISGVSRGKNRRGLILRPSNGRGGERGQESQEERWTHPIPVCICIPQQIEEEQNPRLGHSIFIHTKI